MPQDLTDDKSTLVQVMAWCRQATSHYLNQGWPRSPTPYGVTRPQWVNAFREFVYAFILCNTTGEYSSLTFSPGHTCCWDTHVKKGDHVLTKQTDAGLHTWLRNMIISTAMAIDYEVQRYFSISRRPFWNNVDAPQNVFEVINAYRNFDDMFDYVVNSLPVN